MSKQERRFITPAEAIGLLPDKDQIHVFTNIPVGLVGADWSREDVTELLNEPKRIIEITGEQARNMSHGIAVFHEEATRQSEILFIETDKDKLDAFDKPSEEGKTKTMIEVGCRKCKNLGNDECLIYGKDADEAVEKCAKDRFKNYKKEEKNERRIIQAN